MINPDSPTHHLGSVQIIHSEIGTPLVLIRNKGEPFGFPGPFIANEVDIDDLSVPEIESRLKIEDEIAMNWN